MTELTLKADIGAPAEKVFDLITDFGGQDRWLAPSSSFRGTRVLNPGPVALGTRYRESDPFGVRNGTVTEFQRPATVTFQVSLGGVVIPAGGFVAVSLGAANRDPGRYPDPD